jgi:hypothetical protein
MRLDFYEVVEGDDTTGPGSWSWIEARSASARGSNGSSTWSLSPVIMIVGRGVASLNTTLWRVL